MNLIKLSALSALLIAAGCCKPADTEPQGGDLFVFGTAYGMCMGDCAHFYKVQGGLLYADMLTQYGYDNALTFSNRPVNDPIASFAIQLKDQFPQYLLDHPDTTFGCPDCGDQGGYHLQLRKDGVTHYWHIDTWTQYQPEEIKEYVQKIDSVINTLTY